MTEPLRVSIVAELPAKARIQLREDELILWFGAPAAHTRRNYFDYLSEEERARAASFRFETDRWSFGAAHAGLRALLGPMVSRAPNELRFSVGTYGKPYLDHEGQSQRVHFSISHTRGCVFAAVARSAVGVDVERRRPITELLDVAKTAFGPEGRAALARLGCAARTALFYRYWTLGEAFIKATGEGIAQDLASFAFTEKGVPSLTRVGEAWGPPGRWRFHCEP